jgi:ADP-heptose:LPS heptosyltransferase
MPKSSPSALIIRLDAIGDALALTPLLAALRSNAIPADVVLLAGNAEAFSSRAARRIVVGHFDLRSSRPSNLAAIERLGRHLALHRYTHALVATEDPSGYRLALASQAAARIGFSNAWGKPAKTLWSRRFLTDSVYRSAGLDRRAPHECQVLFRLGRSLLSPSVKPTRDPAELRPLVIESEPPPDRRIAVQITDKWARLGIGLEQVEDLVRRASAFGELRLISAASESRYAARIATATGCTIESFAAMAPWKAAIAAAPAFVAPDCGALHVAGMIGTPVVGVFPPTRDFRLQVARWAPWAAPHRIVRADDGWPVRAADALAQLLRAMAV